MSAEPAHLEPDLDPGDHVIGRVSVWKVIDSDGAIRTDVVCDDGDGDPVDTETAVGMLAYASHLLICDRC